MSGMGFCSAKQKNGDIKCRFCNASDNDGHLFWECPFPPFLKLRRSPEFAFLMKQDRTKWPRCALCHGWLPGLTAGPSGSPWAVAASDLASHNLEKVLGHCSICTDSPWHPTWDQEDTQDMADSVPDQRNIWSWGTVLLLDMDVAGAGAFAHLPSYIFDSNQW